MPHVLSFLAAGPPEVERNHRLYAGLNGYSRSAVSSAGLPDIHRRQLMWNSLLHGLRRIPEGDLLVLATDDVLFARRDPVEALLAGRAGAVPTFTLEGRGVARDQFQVWRNTSANREALVARIARSAVHLPPEQAPDAPDDLRVGEAHGAGDIRLAEMCNVRFSPRWLLQDVPLALVIGDHPEYAGSPVVFRDTLSRLVNRQLSGEGAAGRLLEPQVPPATGPVDVFQPRRPGALLCLYTPNIASFGCIAEASFRRYCGIQGLTLYTHRALTLPGMSPAWAKPFLLRQHLRDHDWVMWVDSDVLILNARPSAAALFDDRDIVAAHDIGPWLLNAGILGFRNTPRNLELLDTVCEAIERIDDKSSTYASGGDQTVFCDVLGASGLRAEELCDLLTINTPWYYRDRSSFMVHYYGMQPEYRLMIMREDFASLAG